MIIWGLQEAMTSWLVHICRYITRVMPDLRQVQGVGIRELDDKMMPTPTETDMLVQTLDVAGKAQKGIREKAGQRYRWEQSKEDGQTHTCK